MNKSDLVDALSEAAGMTKADAARAVDAMFDPAGEKAFIEECHEMLGQKTVILITHRPNSLALADRVLKLGK